MMRPFQLPIRRQRARSRARPWTSIQKPHNRRRPTPRHRLRLLRPRASKPPGRRRIRSYSPTSLFRKTCRSRYPSRRRSRRPRQAHRSRSSSAAKQRRSTFGNTSRRCSMRRSRSINPNSRWGLMSSRRWITWTTIRPSAGMSYRCRTNHPGRLGSWNTRRGSRSQRSVDVERTSSPVPVADPAPPQTPAEVLARIEIPQDVIDQISELIVPGSSLVVSDQGLGGETGDGTDFIVITH